MQNKELETQNLQKKSHEILMKLLNNIGIVGAIIVSIVDIICVMIFVFGIEIKTNTKSTIIFSIINTLIGLLINVLLRYQGQRYAEIENEELCSKYYDKKIKETKRYISMNAWQVLCLLKDISVKGITTSFSIFGVIYISIEGSKNPIQILITLATLLLFTCFGLINMNSAYCRFYNKQIPFMQNKIKQKEEQQNGTV